MIFTWLSPTFVFVSELMGLFKDDCLLMAERKVKGRGSLKTYLLRLLVSEIIAFQTKIGVSLFQVIVFIVCFL